MSDKKTSKRSGKESLKKQCVMDSLQISVPDTAKLRKPKSHSAVCLASPTEIKSFEADSSWSKNSSPVSVRESSMSGIKNESSSRRHRRDKVANSNSFREVSFCEVTRVRPGVTGLSDGNDNSSLVLAVKESSNESSRKARWIIIITAVALVLMCILLVGITLRLAPVIDDLVRKENEELHKVMGHHNSTPRPLESTNRTALSSASSALPDG